MSARGGKRKMTIESDFQKIGLDSNNYFIFYTTKKFSKGNFVNNFLKKYTNKEIIFIDDNMDNHLSMLNYFPNSKNYLFEYCEK